METIDYGKMATDLNVAHVFVNDKGEIFTQLDRAMMSVGGDKKKLEIHFATDADNTTPMAETEDEIIAALKAKKGIVPEVKSIVDNKGTVTDEAGKVKVPPAPKKPGAKSATDAGTTTINPTLGVDNGNSADGTLSPDGQKAAADALAKALADNPNPAV